MLLLHADFLPSIQLSFLLSVYRILHHIVKLVKDYEVGLLISTGIYIRDIQEINLRGIIKANRSYEEPLGFGYFMEGLLRICRYRSLFILD